MRPTTSARDPNPTPTLECLYRSGLLDTSAWNALCAVTLTVKQAIWSQGIRQKSRAVDGRSAMKDNVITVTGTIQNETPRAILVEVDGKEVWLPKSRVEVDRMADGTAEIRVPEWLAMKEGLM
jgi:hypothetical protein